MFVLSRLACILVRSSADHARVGKVVRAGAADKDSFLLRAGEAAWQSHRHAAAGGVRRRAEEADHADHDHAEEAAVDEVHDEHEEEGHDEHEEGHDEHEEGHDEHEEGHDEHEEGHDEHEEGHDEHEEGHGEHEGEGGGGTRQNRKRAWRNSMLACLVLLAVTTTGAFLRLPFASALDASPLVTARITMATSAFACGALLATAMFIILFESTHLIAARWQEESQAAWRFGAMVLAGYGTGIVTALVSPHAPAQVTEEELAQVHGSAVMALGDEEVAATKSDDVALIRSIDKGFVFTIFIGDFMHNLVDGIFIANAFLDCRQALGWTVTTATVFHELAQEVSDFFLLITRGGLTVPQALAVNLASGFSAPIGAAIFLLADPGVGGRGLLLAFSGGVYIYIACTEAAQHVVHSTHASVSDRGLAVFFYVLGAICIGLVLIDDFHCTGDEAEGGGDGHGH